MSADALQAETVDVLRQLIRFNTVNPPGNERPAIEYLERFLADAGFETEILGASDERANLVATLKGEAEGPTMVFLGHVDTVLADASEWTHDPWSAEIADGYMWGRGTVDMKNQVAAEAVAGVTLARSGWRPTHGTLKLVFVADEETGGEHGAQYLCENHADKVRCDLLVNEGGGGVFEFSGKRHYGICCAEKGIFRFKVTARGAAGHASIPRTGDNALLKLGGVLQKLAQAKPDFMLTEAPTALLTGLGLDPDDPQRAIDAIGAQSPALQILVEPMLGVTLTPTMAEASQKINVIPSKASLKIDCRVPPGLGEQAALKRLHDVLGDELDRLDVEFTEKVFGNGSPVDSPLTKAIDQWIAEQDPGAVTVPLILPGFSDSSHFRAAFPECAAYGFFPQRHQPLLESAPLMHNSDERIDLRDLGFAADCYLQLARRLLG